MIRLIEVANAKTASEILSTNPTLRALLGNITDNIIVPILGVLFLLALFMFTWSMVKMIMSADDSDARTDGKSSILWSTIGMFIVLSAYGIIRLIAATLGEVGVEDPFR